MISISRESHFRRRCLPTHRNLATRARRHLQRLLWATIVGVGSIASLWERPVVAQSGSRSKACGRLKVIRVVFAVGRLLPIYLQLQTCRPTCANRGDWAHEWTSSNLAAVGANAQASSITLVASGPSEQCKSQQAASRGSDPG